MFGCSSCLEEWGYVTNSQLFADLFNNRFCKIFKTLTYRQIIQHIQCHNILVCEHCGFRKPLSTDNATIETIFDAWKTGKFIAGVFCDLTKAFDCVNSKLLFKKLEFYYVRSVLSKWFRSYLHDRKQRFYLQLLQFNLKLA